MMMWRHGAGRPCLSSVLLCSQGECDAGRIRRLSVSRSGGRVFQGDDALHGVCGGSVSGIHIMGGPRTYVSETTVVEKLSVAIMGRVDRDGVTHFDKKGGRARDLPPPSLTCQRAYIRTDVGRWSGSTIDVRRDLSGKAGFEFLSLFLPPFFFLLLEYYIILHTLHLELG